jgi:hypothetical protein
VVDSRGGDAMTVGPGFYAKAAVASVSVDYWT